MYNPLAVRVRERGSHLREQARGRLEVPRTALKRLPE
jgi:hypothetical protein